VPAYIEPQDLPRGFVVGVIYEPRSGMIEQGWWIAHIGLPPFVMRVSEATDEDVEEGDVWASVTDQAVLTHPRWLSAVGCDTDELRHLATTAAAVIQDNASEDMAIP
jgi:hypothetical protein